MFYIEWGNQQKKKKKKGLPDIKTKEKKFLKENYNSFYRLLPQHSLPQWNWTLKDCTTKAKQLKSCAANLNISDNNSSFETNSSLKTKKTKLPGFITFFFH